MDRSAFVETFKSELRRARKEQKSNDILDYIKNNWKLFRAPSRAYVNRLCEELEQSGEVTVTDLADAMGIPQEIMFKKVKLADTAKLLLKFGRSPLYAAFEKLVEARAERCGHTPDICMVAVAGEHTLIITNMPARTVPGLVNITMTAATENGRDINIMTAEDAPQRLPSLFGQEQR